MTDPMQQLRDANPVPAPAGYPAATIPARIAEAIDSLDIERATADRGGRNRFLPLLVAAAVVVLALITAVVVHGRSSGRSAPASVGASAVTCAVSTTGGHRVTAARLAQAHTVVADRMATLGGTATHLRSDAAAGTVGFDPRGISVTRAQQACRVTTASIRPVVTPPVQQRAGAALSADPLHGLRFAVPGNAADLARLTAAQRTQLSTAMSHYDCKPGPAPADTTATPACDQQGGVYLLGPALVGSTGVHTATAVGPSASGFAEWSVQLHLTTTAAGRFATFTAAHNVGGLSRDESIATCGQAVPCADYLAFVVDGTVVSAPVTESRIDADVQVAGALTERSTRALAADFTAAAIGLRAA